MTSRKAVVAMSVLVPILLGVSALAYTSMTAAGMNPSDNDGNSYGNPHCTTTVSTENVGNNAIQTAITAASSGAVICVSAGTYPEQLSISQSLTLAGLGNQHNPTTIAPTSVTSNAVSPDSGHSEAAIILASGATHVTITNLVIDGSTASSSIDNGCSPPSYEGVLFLGASGALTNSKVTNFYQASPSLYGCQDNVGDAVLVQTPSSGSSSVTISGNTVANYQKNGITCNDAGSVCSIHDNTVSPLAAATSSTGDATNGIQVAYGAIGTVSENTVTGNECNTSNCGANLVTDYQAAGILTFQSGVGTVVRDNTVSGNDIGIATVYDSAVSTNNQIQNNRYEGLLVNDGTYGDSNNQLVCDHHNSCLIGIAEVSDGGVTGPTTATLDGSSFSGTFATALVQVTAYTGAPNGGSNVEPAVLSINGLTETVTAGASTSPSFVNLTSIPDGGFGQFQH